MNNPEQILKASKSILLVDWPNPGVPRALVEAGFTVYSFSPDKYSKAEIVDAGQRMQFTKLDNSPPQVDIVNVFRPIAELPGIIEKHALPLGAKCLWLHPPAISEEVRSMAEDNGLQYVEGYDIAAIAKMV